ncbi:helix-turn-helix domain-containing protein [Microscilla marina]|uniref:Putative transcriptional regulator n=1 Tax=Microscilla marina ATCC 23134 TaxID=313606 RepID=A1ZHX9_MICM2|nr:AraC family transcriptional regulator [Microscilla marina]EAY30136.1 putative transcriptional regulator [Microscilla marina ATCC 23134]
MKYIPVRDINATQKSADFQEDFSIRSTYELPTTGKTLSQPLHRHDFFYMLALDKGSGTHEIDFVPYEVCDHSVVFMRPGQVHQHQLKADRTGYLIAFKPDFYYPTDSTLYQLLRKASSVHFYQLDTQRFAKLWATMASMLHEYTHKQVGYREVIKAHLSILFTELIRQNAQRLDVPLYQQEKLDEFLLLIETHFATHKSPAQYAQLMHLSTYQLNAITKATLGKTCSKVISEYIILEAKRHLLATTHQVNQIAYHLGYEDVSYFIRFFRKHTGHSPKAFRHK